MPEREPADVKNLDRYGNAPLPWSRPRDLLAGSMPGPEVAMFLSTTRPDGRPHTAGIGALWHDGDLYFTSDPDTRKSRDAVQRPECRSITVAPLPLRVPHSRRGGERGAVRRHPLSLRALISVPFGQGRRRERPHAQRPRSNRGDPPRLPRGIQGFHSSVPRCLLLIAADRCRDRRYRRGWGRRSTRKDTDSWPEGLDDQGGRSS